MMIRTIDRAGKRLYFKRHQLDRLYQRLVTDLDALFNAVGLKTAA